MKEKSKEWQEANFSISVYLGLTWFEACKLNQSDREFLLEKANKMQSDLEEQHKAQAEAQARQVAEHQKYMEQYAAALATPPAVQQQPQPTLQPADPTPDGPEREMQPWG